MKKFKKNRIQTLLIIIFSFLIIVPTTTYFLIQSTSFQNFVTKKIASYFSSKFETKVEVGNVDFRFFNSLILNNFYIEDQSSDTLAFISSVQVKIRGFDLKENSFNFSKVYIDSLKCFLKSDTLKNNNYDFIADAFSSDDIDNPQDTTETKIHLSLKKLQITNSKFLYKIEKNNYKENGIDFDNFYLTNFNLDAENLLIEDDSLFVFINDLNLKEQSGFELEELSTGFISSPNELSTKFLYFKTANSQFITDHLKLNFSSYDDFENFTEKVNISAKIENETEIFTEDLNYFLTELWGYNEKIILSGKFDGTVNNLIINDLNIKLKNFTRFSSSMKIKGLPDINNTYFDININELSTSTYELASIRNKITNKQLIVLPEVIRKLGNINYKSKIVGKIDDFLVSGNLKTDMGNIYTDVILKNDTTKKILKLNGIVDGENLQIGTILNDEEQFGILTFKNNIEISLINNQDIKGQTKTSISEVFFNNYLYKNINIEGDFTDKSFNGAINIDDKNLITDFSGFVNFETEVPLFDFTLNIEKANLFPLNFEKEDSASFISTEINAKFIGTTLDDLNGEISMTKPLKYQKNLELYQITNFNIKSVVNEYIAGKEKKTFYVNSDFFEGKIEGIFEFKTLLESLTNLATDYIPSISSKPKNIKEILDPFAYHIGSNFNFDFIFYSTEILTKIFAPKIKISDSTKISGKYRDNPLNKYLAMNINTKSINIDDIIIENINISTKTSNENSLKSSINCNKIFVSEKIKIDTVEIETIAKNDSLQLNLNWENFGEKLNKGKVKTLSIFSRDSSNIQTIINTTFNNDTFFIDNSEWFINAFSSHLDTLGFQINTLDLINSKESIRIGIAGRISDNPEDELLIRLLNFDLSSLNTLVDNLKIEGRMVSDIKIKDITGTPILNSYNTISAFKINDVKLGRLIATSEWLQDSSKMKIRVFTERYTNEELVDISYDSLLIDNNKGNEKEEDSIKYINIAGDYFVKDKKIDFIIDFYRLKLSTFKPYLENVIDGVTSSSVLFGNMKITGTTEKPKIDGNLQLKGAAFRVIFTNVYYTVAKDLNISITNNEIEIEETKLNNSKGTGYALLKGTIFHNLFSDFYLDINLAPNNFMFLNTQKNDTSSFYGTVYSTGDINLSGSPTNLNLTSQIKTEKGTELYFQLDSEQEIDINNSFIKFVSNDTIANFEENTEEENTDYYGFGMNINISINPETKLQIILDETTGDIINVQGSGDLKLKMNTVGDVNLFGTLILEQGDYMFTMKNLIKKRFEIEKGGTLKWDGDPANALLDLSAMYKIKGVDLYDLVLDEDFRDVKVPVECFLNISENLMSPTVEFGLQLPKSNERIMSQINNLDAENLNKQVISLLVLGRFQPLPGLTQTEDPSAAEGVINTGEVLSNQLNHWLSQISDDFDVGVNYQTGDALTSDEVEVALSTQIFDDRITINGNVGVGGDVKTSENPNTVVGDVDIEVKLNKKGNLKFKVFNKSNDDLIYEREKGLYTQGIGVFYKKEFDKIFNKKKKIEKDSIN